jgi:hypothetical protein
MTTWANASPAASLPSSKCLTWKLHSVLPSGCRLNPDQLSIISEDGRPRTTTLPSRCDGCPGTSLSSISGLCRFPVGRLTEKWNAKGGTCPVRSCFLRPLSLRLPHARLNRAVPSTTFAAIGLTSGVGGPAGLVQECDRGGRATRRNGGRARCRELQPRIRG